MVTTNTPHTSTTPIHMKQETGRESPLFEPEKMDDDTDELAPSPLAPTAPLARMYNETQPQESKVIETPPTNAFVSKRRKSESISQALHASSFDLAALFSDLSDSLVDDSNGETTEPYDPKEEGRPTAKVPAFRDGFVTAERIIIEEVVQYILTAIRDLKRKQPSSELLHMEQRAEKLATPSYAHPVIAIIRGSTGKGKSTLITALLNALGIALRVRIAGSIWFYED